MAPSGESQGGPSLPLCPPPRLPLTPDSLYSPDLHSPGEGELRRPQREAVVSRVRAKLASQGRDSAILPLSSGGSAHLQQRHCRLGPRNRRRRKRKRKPSALRGGNQNFFFHIPLPFPRRGQWAAGDQKHLIGDRLLCSAVMLVGETMSEERLSEEKEKERERLRKPPRY